MAKPKALLLTEGMHGMISQAEGMAKALKTEYNHKIVRLSFPWNLIPPKFTPISKIILKDRLYITNNEKPDLIISCGRKSVIPSILLKKENPEILTIHIQNPKVNLKNFDIIIAPEHDGLTGKNIFTSKGAIHYITDSEINEAKNYLSDKIKSKKIVSLILGGPNKYYSFNKNQLAKIFSEVKFNFVSKGYEVIVIPSMRTPKDIIDLANFFFNENGCVLNSVDKKAYLSSLALAESIVVTCDSTSMISEAATSGKPIFVAHMKAKKNNYRFKKFFKLFKEIGIIKNLGEKVESWNYIKLNEAERIAKEISAKIKK
ncbi:MAG TPA: nucleoside-diphosphate sugar epimerase [Candidatus Pelagibacter sp.]|jgi:mitochondrial fission protein ELM1|nr:nucleoside-diphosphate sugar epimerase [Candidatus Pelagibacter sp.]